MLGRQWNYDGNSNPIGSYGTNMSAISNTKLYYVQCPNEAHMTTMAFFGVKDWGWSGGDDNIVSKRANYTNNKYTDSYNTGLDGGYHLYTPANGNANASLTKTDYNSRNDMNGKNQTLKVTVDGATPSTLPAILKLKGTYLSEDNASTRGEISLNSVSGSYNCVVTGLVTMSYSNLVTGYQFDGWYNGSTKVGSGTSYEYNNTGETTITAKFSEITYNITATANPAAGGTVTPTTATAMGQISGGNITATNNPGYHFVNWEVGTATGTFGSSTTASTTFKPTKAGTVVANFAANEYAITYNGEHISSYTDKVEKGTYNTTITVKPVAAQDYAVDGITVTKTDDASAVSSDDEAPYTFEQPAFPVTVTVRTHSTAVTTYTIRFLNYDGTVLQSGQVEEGHTPVYSGATPTKPSDAEWDYTFNGWTPTIAAATQDQDYTATYSSTRRKYTLTWDYAGGSVVTEGTPAGQVANADPITAPELNKTGYTFTGWDPTVPATMPAADATYTAQWQENLSSVTTAVNAVGTTAGQTAPTKSVNAIGVTTTSNITASTAKTGYKFVGWTLDNCTRTDGGAADAITITIKGLGNTNAATVTANYVQFVHSGWYMMGTNFGEWDNPTTYEIGYPYRGMANVYYFPTDVSSYFKVHDKSKRYSIDASTTDDITPELGKIYNLVQNETKSMTLSASNVWVIVKTSDTKKFMVQDGSLTYYTVSVSEPTDHSTALTLKDKAWDLETNQYSTNDTYVLSVTAATGYRAVLKVNDVATNWTKTSGSTYTYEAQTSDNTTLTVEYVQQYAVTHGYYTGCSSTMGTYTVTDNETAISSGTKVDAGTVVTFAAEANTGYQFDGWYTSTSATGDPESTETTYNKTINATTSLYAKFSKKRWTVTVAKAGTGDGTLIPDAGSYSVTQVDGQSFTATPAKGSWFEGWTITTGTGSWTETKFYPTSDATITATFTAYVRSLAVTNVNVGKMATVTFTKDGHYSNPAITYELWKGDQSTKVTDGTTFTPTQTGATFVAQVAGTYTVKAIVKQNETTVDEVFSNAFTIGAVYTVNFAVSPLEKGCTVTPATPKENVEIDTPFAISATAGTGYHFNKWVAEPENTFTFEDATSASTQVTMTAAAVTSTITATFSPNTYSVRFNANSPSGQKATGTMEDQSFEYDEAAKALTENAFVRLGYNFLGWSADASATEATYTDKQAVQNLATESGAVVNLYAVWQLKNDCSITVTQPDASDGTITPSEKVTNANVEGTVYTYTFTPASDAVTFMNWTITNAICVDGTNERSNPVKIKTYGEATIRANVKENLVSVTLKVLPNDQWGYFKVNGNNVASGTVINVGSKTDAKVFAYTNFGYAFTDPKFEWSEDITDLIDFNEENGVMKGKGKVGKVTLIANFKVDTYTNWKLFGDWDWNNGIEFRKHADQNTKKIAYATVHLTLKGSAYQFQLDKSGTRYYNEGTMNDNGYRFGWIFKQTNAIGQNCKFGPPQEGDYVFRLDYNNEDKPTLTVLMPDDQHYFPEGTTIYFNNHNENSWGRSIIRFGCDGGMAEAYDMTLVPGTANLYSYTFPDGYKYFQVYQIANNYGWTGAKDKSGSTTYGIRNIGEGDYKIGRATDDLTDGAAAGYVIRIQTNHSKGNYDVEYYRRDVWNTLESSRYSVTYTKNDFTGGSLKVEQWENNDGSARTTLEAGTTKVDQSRWITITATPEIGYKFVKMSVTTSGGTADHYETTWKYAVHEDITAITAEFEQVNKYTFYVKNTTDANWHKNGETAETRDVYIYYDNAKGGDQKVSYWGWPGLMATPMDKNHEWYKVEMTNAYFTIGNWILNNGVGPDCPQTIPYAADNGVPKFNSQEMEGKYYEIVQKGDEFNTYELQAASATPSFYRVITNDGKYTSNVATVDEKVSFFATTAGAKLQKSGESGWTDVDGGTISISESNVYVATITEGDAISTPEVYKGNYYIRTDGADGRWGDYKDPSKNNAMTYFTPRPGETYSYYWIQNLGKGEGSFNVKAKVANDYNDNLAGEIANDANTNIYGNINQTANGSNVRFSYEPTTNAFERAILSGSADDSYLNIVGANIYSDVSCKAEFALDMDTYKTNPKACKLRDISDWVYEMTIYAKVPDTETAIGVDMYSLYNGNRSTLLNNKVYVTIPAFNLKSNESALDYLPEEYLLKSDEDLVQQQIKPLFVENDPTSLELYHKFKKRVNYVYHGFVRAPGYETKLYRFIFSESVHNLIHNGSKEILNEASKIVTDRDSGFDFNLRVTEKTISKNGRTTKMKDYSSSSFARSATALTEAEKNYLETTKISNLKDYIFKKPNVEQMQVMVEMFNASMQEQPYNVVKWGKVFRPDNLQLDANGNIKNLKTDSPKQKVNKVNSLDFIKAIRATLEGML